MALQGSLDDFALPDVLSLLSSTRKSGELQVSGERGGEGHVWMDGGRIVSCETGATTDVVDTLFELLRYRSGTFVFSIDVVPPSVGEARDVAPLLQEASRRLAEWRVIEAVVPSLATRATLSAELPTPAVQLEAEQWKVLVAVANGGTVAAVANALALGEFSACKAVKALVDAGLVIVDPVFEQAAAREVDVEALVQFPARRNRRAHTDLSSTPEEPASEEPATGATAMSPFPSADLSGSAGPGRPLAAHALARQLAAGHMAADGEGAIDDPDAELFDEHGEPINKSLLLKFLSSVRS